ncbi:MAG TPA: hypothetical protein VFH95_03190 [Candidatus Kapabacteria bacterium]|nr:hypothetical protein [Candidatus Kapabacteria bacterium]
MKSKQLFAIILFVIAAGLLGWWIAAGHHPWTTTQRMVSVPATDPLFGTTVVTQKWVNQFTPGIEMIGPAVVVLAGIGSWMLWRNRKQSRAI